MRKPTSLDAANMGKLIDYLPHRARLDLAGWADKDIFSHEA